MAKIIDYRRKKLKAEVRKIAKKMAEVIDDYDYLGFLGYYLLELSDAVHRIYPHATAEEIKAILTQFIPDDVSIEDVQLKPHKGGEDNGNDGV